MQNSRKTPVKTAPVKKAPVKKAAAKKTPVKDDANGGGANGNAKPAYPVNSVDNALRMLALFREHDSIRLSEVSDELGIGRSTAHRLLSMLQYHGYVEQDTDTKAYRYGPALIEIGLGALRDLDIRRHMHPHIEALCRETGETVHLMILQGKSVLCIDSAEATQALRIGSRIGSRIPAHAMSGGKVLLAELSDEQVEQLYTDRRLERIGPKSLTKREQLMRELHEIRERGYATNFAESEPDIGAVAGVVRGASGIARGSVAISAPLSRLPESRVPELVEALQRTLARASVNLV